VRKLNRIITEIVGWVFLVMAFSFVTEVFQKMSEESPAIVVGGAASVGVFFAVLGFGFLFLNRVEEIKYNSRTPENDEYAEEILKQEEEKKNHNWLVIGIIVAAALIAVALLPVFL